MSRSSDGQPPDSPDPGAALTPEELMRRLREPGDLTEREIAALDRVCADPDDDCGPADDDMLPRDDDEPGSDEPGQAAARDVLDAGFTHRYPTPGATGFRAGGPLDRMLPGSDLAWHVGAERQRGLTELSDGELIGLLAAARRGESWQAAMVLAATTELDARRAGPDGREGEYVADEVATALKLTGRSAQDLLELSRQLERLPHTAGLLAAGIIDERRAAVIARHLALLPDDAAAAVDAALAPKAGDKTTGELGAACHKAVIAYDPEAYERRKKQAEKNARVECWTEPTGTAAIAGRDLDRTKTIAAEKSIDEAARWLAAHGLSGSTDELRAEVLLARLGGLPLETLIPPADPAGQPASTADQPASPTGQPPTTQPLGGVNLTVPLTTWLGLTDRPGEISGTGAAGPADPGTCRGLADALARQPKARWCITLTDTAGRAVAHGCARAGPGPPGGDKRTWLATVTITPIETGSCSHREESKGYRPSRTLRHRIKIRSPRCGFPGCRRSAWRCDDDHTIPYDRGGRTCECNLYPLCRHHHQVKQGLGWHLAQPEPGILVWTTPSGRSYTVGAEPYPV
jgi:hypothetical protein